MSTIAAAKLIYRRELLDTKTATMEVAPTLRAQAKERKMTAGTAGLAEGHHPHVRGAADLLKAEWSSVSAAAIARCNRYYVFNELLMLYTHTLGIITGDHS